MSTAQPGGNGQLPSAKAILVTFERRTHVRSFTLHNVGASTETCLVYLKFGTAGVSRRKGRYVLAPNESAQLVPRDGYWPIPANTSIEGETTNATSVDYIILGDADF